MSFLSFKRQDDGTYKFEQGNYAIVYNKHHQAYFYVDNKQITFYQFDSFLELIENIDRLYHKYKPKPYDFNKPLDDDFGDFAID